MRVDALEYFIFMQKVLLHHSVDFLGHLSCFPIHILISSLVALSKGLLNSLNILGVIRDLIGKELLLRSYVLETLVIFDKHASGGVLDFLDDLITHQLDEDLAFPMCCSYFLEMLLCDILKLLNNLGRTRQGGLDNLP